MKTPTSFYVFKENDNEWQETTLEELAAENDPDIMVVPLYSDGTQGEQTTWGVWDKERKRSIVDAELKKASSKQEFHPEKQGFIDYLFREEVIAPPPAQETPAQKPQEKQLDELERLALLPEEIRAVDYLMRNTQLTGMISEAKTFFQKAADLITLVLVINIIAIALLGIVFIFSLGK